MDGPWQIGHLEAEEYGRKAREAAKMMRWQDPSIKLIAVRLVEHRDADLPRVGPRGAGDAAGSRSTTWRCTTTPPTTRTTPPATSPCRRSSSSTSTRSAGLLRYVKAKRRSKHDVYLSWDEWNVWYKDRSGQRRLAARRRR